MTRMLVAAVAGLGLIASACTTTDPATGRTDRNNTRTGVLVGALLGAAAGCATNTNSGEQCRKNALIGAGVGAVAGAGVGRYMDAQQRALEQELSGTGVGVRREGDNIRLVMPSAITFPVDGDAVDPSFFPVLNDVAGVFQEYPATFVDVAGHTDATGSDSYNQGLSERRARNVAQVLMGAGVTQERFGVFGYGETQPIATNDTEAGRASNRRVEVLLRPNVVS